MTTNKTTKSQAKEEVIVNVSRTFGETPLTTVLFGIVSLKLKEMSK